MGKLFEELKRRKVFRVAAVYAIVAWLIIQVAGEILPTFDAPQWVNQTIILILILGFPIALVLAWAFEVTPEGIRTDTLVQSTPPITQSTDRKLIYAIFVLVLMVAGFQVADRLGISPAIDTVALVTNAGSASRLSRRYTIELGASRTISSIGNSQIALSADGRRLAYTLARPGQSQGQLTFDIAFAPDAPITIF